VALTLLKLIQKTLKHFVTVGVLKHLIIIVLINVAQRDILLSICIVKHVEITYRKQVTQACHTTYCLPETINDKH